MVVDLGGQLPDGESAGGAGQGEYRAEGVVDARFVEVDASDPDGSDRGGPGEVGECVVGEKADVDTVHCGTESLGDPGEPGDDGRELLQDAADLEIFGVMRGGFETQHVFAFGVCLHGKSPESDLEPGQVIPRCLDHGFDRAGTRSVMVGPGLGAEDGAHSGYVQTGPSAVDHPVE
jgi:hypothetical protein